MTDDEQGAARRRRRAVGPPGAATTGEPALDVAPPVRDEADPAGDERLRRDRPPHHDRGV